MRRAVIEGGIVANIIEADADFAPGGMMLVDAEDAGARIGGTWDGAAFGPPPPVAIERERDAMTVTLAQLRIALAEAGLLAAVEARVLATPRAATIWEYGGAIRRNSPLIAAATGAGVTDEAIDTVFRAAMRVEV
jgi:hypothetical protein